MKVIVTGGAGFIGSHVSQSLLELGCKVVLVDSLDNFLYSADRKKENLKELKSLGGDLTLLLHDILEDSAKFKRELVDSSAIINCAALPGLVKSWSHFREYSRNNIDLTHLMAESMMQFPDISLIHLSTSSVYGLNACGNEELPTNPVSPYGVTKLAAENILKAYESNFPFRLVLLRLFSVYGPRQRPDMGIYNFINAISKNQSFAVHGNGEQTRSPTYVLDAVQAIVKAMNDKEVKGIFNIAGAKRISILEIIATLEKLTGRRALFNFIEKRDGDQLHTEGNSDLAKDILGYTPTTSMEQGLFEQVEWQLKAQKHD